MNTLIFLKQTLTSLFSAFLNNLQTSVSRSHAQDFLFLPFLAASHHFTTRPPLLKGYFQFDINWSSTGSWLTKPPKHSSLFCPTLTSNNTANNFYVFIESKLFTVASLLPLFASNTERITSESMLGNISWMAFKSSCVMVAGCCCCCCCCCGCCCCWCGCCGWCPMYAAGEKWRFGFEMIC